MFDASEKKGAPSQNRSTPLTTSQTMSNDNTIYLAGADWCGYTRKFEADMINSGTQSAFTKLDCAKEDANDPKCAVSGYPTFVNAAGQICHRGYATPETVIANCGGSSGSQEPRV